MRCFQTAWFFLRHPLYKYQWFNLACTGNGVVAARGGFVCGSAAGLCTAGSDCQGFDGTGISNSPGNSKNIIINKKITL